MSDFSDRPFVAGSLVGLRAFAIDAYGRLHGPSYDSVFRPGENVATCRKPDDDGMWQYFQPVTFSSGGFTLSDDPTLAAAAVESKPLKKESQHRVAGKDCSCGFYAYYDGRNDYLKVPSGGGGWTVTFGGATGASSRDRIGAVIEGFGVCTVGSRGFRAEKARLLALIQPEVVRSPLKFDLLVRNYPDVDMFADESSALEAHPLTVPDVPGPDSPGFWERPVA